jgi:hypothetical protein
MEQLYAEIAVAAIVLVVVTRLMGWGCSVVLGFFAAAYWFYDTPGLGLAVLAALGLYLAFVLIRILRGRYRAGLGSGPSPPR